MSGKNENSRREAMKRAIANKPKPAPAGGRGHRKQVAKVAAAATPAPGPKKPNYRSAASRDARARARGRLPDGAWVRLCWDGAAWRGELHLVNEHGASWKCFTGTSDGMFRLAEELDVAFWAWYAAPKEGPDVYVAEGLTWTKQTKKPEPLPDHLKNPPQGEVGGAGDS